MPKKEKIEQMFNSIAPDYDRLNHLMSLGVDRSWRKRAIRQITDGSKAQELLDIACGTGDFSIALAKAMHPGSHVTGLDLSEGMLGIMEKKVVSEGLGDRISMMQGDSENMPFPDGSFDCASIAFGIRNFENRETALREILRVLRPGGSLVILELSVPSNRLLRAIYNIYFTRVMPLVGGRISGDKAAYRYLPASVLHFPGKEEWTATMRSCGYGNVRHKAFTFGICRMYTGEKSLLNPPAPYLINPTNDLSL